MYGLFSIILHFIKHATIGLLGMIVLSFSNLLYSQAPDDSLLLIMKSTVDSSQKLSLLQEIYQPLIYDDPQSCIRYARQALEIAEDLRDFEGEVDALQTIAWVYQGLSYLVLALDRSFRAEHICKSKGLEEPLGNIYNTMGSIEYGNNNLRGAIDYFRRSLVIRRKFGPQSSVAASLNNIGLLSMETEEMDTAREYLTAALGLYKEIDFERGEITVMGNLGDLFRMEKDFNQARSQFQEAIDKAHTASLEDLVVSLNYALAVTEKEAGNLTQSRYLLEAIVDSSDRENPLNAIVYGELAGMAEEKGELKKALTYLKIQSEINDSLKARERVDQLESVQTINKISLEEKELEFKEQQDALSQEEQLKRAKLVSGLYLLGAIFLLVIAVTLFLRFREHRRLSRRLSVEVEDRTEALVKAHSELNTFIYQSSHDLRGPINTIMGLQQLLEDGSLETTQVATMLDRKVRQLEKGQRSLVHSMELRNREARRSLVDIRELLADVLKRIREDSASRSVDFRFDIESGLIFPIDPWVLAVTLEHLIDNAVVFRSNERNPWVKIGARLKGTSLEISISDNGIGMSDEVREHACQMFYRGSNQSTGNGLGLYNVQLAIDLLRGSIGFEGIPGKGTTVRVVFSEILEEEERPEPESIENS